MKVQPHPYDGLMLSSVGALMLKTRAQTTWYTAAGKIIRREGRV